MTEHWKPINGYEGLYEVSDLGNVRSLNLGNRGFTRNLYLKPHKDGYRQVELFRNGQKRMLTVHRLVAQAFLPNPNGYDQVNHIDFDRSNNDVSNLEWCDASYNALHSWKNPKRKRRISKNGNERICQYDRNLTLIREWESCIEIKREKGFNQTSIWECCNGKRKTAYGYCWRYAN